MGGRPFPWRAAIMSTTHSVLIEDTGPMVTKTGRVLTDADVEAWADEAAERPTAVSGELVTRPGPADATPS